MSGDLLFWLASLPLWFSWPIMIVACLWLLFQIIMAVLATNDFYLEIAYRYYLDQIHW